MQGGRALKSVGVGPRLIYMKGLGSRLLHAYCVCMTDMSCNITVIYCTCDKT